MKIGDRVRIVRQMWGHPSQNCFTNAVGTISMDVDPFPTRPLNRRYGVEFDEPLGENGYLDLFPVFTEDLELIDDQS
jgi:hypothetical protein